MSHHLNVCDDPVQETRPSECGLLWQVIWAHVHALLATGLKPQDLGVITPYNAQVTRLRGLRPTSLASLEVSTVDGFQGEPPFHMLANDVSGCLFHPHFLSPLCW